MLSAHKDKSDVVRFVKQKLESANWFVEAVEERKHTIAKVMESIIMRFLIQMDVVYLIQ